VNRDDVKQRVIKKNHLSVFPSDYIILDSETRKEDFGEFQHNYFKLGWACHVERRPERKQDTETWKFFDKAWPFCKWLESKSRPKRPLWVFSHNLFFDLQVLCFYEYFARTGWELDFIYEAALSYIIIIRREDQTIKGVSTTNYFDTSLDEIGKLVGYEKLKVDFDTVSDEELATYCRRDVEVLKLALERYFDFLKTHDLGKFGMTKASQAFNAYRHRFMKNKIYTHTEDRLIELEKDAYMGGRTECFYIGEIKGKRVLSLDINSMYPFIMRRYKFPCRFIDYQENVDPSALPRLLGKLCAVAEVLVETDEPYFAVRSGNKIIFPIGRFRCYLCTRGLNLAIYRGLLRGVIAISFYEAADLFSDYVNFFYSLKEKYDREGNAIYRKLVKYFLNCLYGKFAQFRPVMDYFREDTGPLVFRSQWYDAVTGEKGVEYKLMNRVVRETGREIARNSLVPISAHITEDARLYLDEIIRGIGRDRVLYCDTDSVKIFDHDKHLLKHKIDPHELGALKVEEEYSYLQIIGPKAYITDETKKLKGIPARANEVKHWVYRYTSFPRQATHLRKGIVDYFETRTIDKKLKSYYDKGTVTDSGKVTPYRLTEF
jgi:hypothetical protein